MALGRLQEHVARIALALPQARTLAEFDGQEALTVAAALRVALASSGFEIRNASKPPHENRFVVVEPESGSSVEVEIFADGGRLRPRVSLEIGPVLHRDDLAADKTLALWARAEPRDFVDVVALRQRYGGPRLLQLAAEKDRGFTTASFVEALQAIGRLTPSRWSAAGVSAERAAEIVRAVEQWRAELAG